MRHTSLEELYNTLDHLLESKDRVLVAIDGYSGSGKSSLAEMIQQRTDCNLFHMDDFFLQEHQRTPERLLEPGGNVDYERFLNEVLLPLSEGRAFEYRIFDCQSMAFTDTVRIQAKRLNIIEGSYSHHPSFKSYYDLAIFLNITPEEQSQRILQRNGPFMHQRFLKEWIPLENQYFETQKIKENSDLVLSL